MLILILGLALMILILTIVLVALQRKDIIEIVIDVKYPWRFKIIIKKGQAQQKKRINN